MLTQEILKANSALAGLSEDQITAITELSTRDENIVIGRRIGELHEQYEQDVLTSSGIAKTPGEKGYVYLKRAVGELKGKVAEQAQLTSEIETYKTKVASLEQQVNSGGGAAVAQKLKDAENALAQMQTALAAEKETFSTKQKEYEQRIKDTQVNNSFALATAQIKLKAGYSDLAKQSILSAAKQGILVDYTPDFDDAGGLIFRDAKGEIAVNKTDLKPLTFSTLLMDKLKDDVEVTGAAGAGTGAKGPIGEDRTVLPTDISSAKSQVEADRIIVKHLLQQGLSKMDPEFGKKQQELRNEYGVQKLPIQ